MTMAMFKVHMKFETLDAHEAFMRKVNDIYEGIELIRMEALSDTDHPSYDLKGEVTLPDDDDK
jgi:hypothetical protein